MDERRRDWPEMKVYPASKEMKVYDGLMKWGLLISFFVLIGVLLTAFTRWIL